MKIKALFASFNIVLIISFLIIFFLPFFILDAAFMREFWLKNWYLAVIFLGILIFVNILFFSYRKIFTCLEAEDWPALAQYLETEIFEKNRITKRKAQLLCDALLILGDFATVKKLEDLLRTKKPRLFASLDVRFVSAVLLSADYNRMYTLAGELAEMKGAERDWMHFFMAFSVQLSGRFSDAADRFLLLTGSAKDPLVTAMSGYLSGVVLSRKLPERKSALVCASDEARKRLLDTYSVRKWSRFIADSKADMHVVILSKLVDETGKWLFPPVQK